MMAMACPTGTVVPSGTSIWRSTPAEVASNSTTALSVSISRNGVAQGDLAALFRKPPDDCALFHVVAHLGHVELSSHLWGPPFLVSRLNAVQVFDCFEHPLGRRHGDRFQGPIVRRGHLDSPDPTHGAV